MVKSLATRTLGKSGIKVSLIGTGLWAVGGGWGPVDDKNALAAIDASLDAEDVAAINEAEAQIDRGEGIDLATLRAEMSKRFVKP